MASADPGRGGLTAINITPMVDIMLVLLVIFMVTTTTISNLDGLDVDRPDAASGQPLDRAPSDQIVVTCRADGKFGVDGQVMSTDAQIRAAVAARRRVAKKLEGLIACDEDASVRALVRVLDLLRLEGVDKYAIVTEAPPTGA